MRQWQTRFGRLIRGPVTNVAQEPGCAVGVAGFQEQRAEQEGGVGGKSRRRFALQKTLQRSDLRLLVGRRCGRRTPEFVLLRVERVRVEWLRHRDGGKRRRENQTPDRVDLKIATVP